MNSKLSSGIRPSPQSWDPRDDALLVYLKESENMGWKQIANYFSSRTSNACQFRWRRLKSGKLKTYNAESVVTLDPQYLSHVKNFKTGSLLVDDLKSRHSRFGRRVVSSIEPARSSSSSSARDFSATTATPATTLLTASTSTADRQEFVMAEKLRAATSESTSANSTSVHGSLAGDEFTQSVNQLPSSLKQFASPSPFKQQPANRFSPIQLPGTFTFSSRSSPLATRRNSHLPSPESSAIPGSLPPPPISPHWTHEEDQLVLGRAANKLSFDELCILLPSKTNYQVRSRIQQLDKNRLSIASLTTSRDGITLPPLKSSPSVLSSLSSSAPPLSGSSFECRFSAPPPPLNRLSTSTSPALYATTCNTPVPGVPNTAPSSISSSSSSSKVSLFRDQPVSRSGFNSVSVSSSATSSTRLPSISSVSSSSVPPLYPPFAVSTGSTFSSRTLHSPPSIPIAKSRSSGAPNASSVICC